MLTAIASRCKNILLPSGPKYRKLLFGPAAGCVMQVDFRSHTRVYLGLYEKELAKYFRSMVRPGFNSFDVGGQGGYDALMLAKLSGGGRVVSIECEKDAADVMRETFARNPYPIETIEAFVGKSDGDGQVTLDAIAAKTFTPDFIKIDIEGAEFDALLGAQTILKTRKPAMIVETHAADIEAQCIELLRGHGYAPKVVDQRRWLRDTRLIAHNRWLVCESGGL
jgi:hypothetical protein